MASIPRLFTVRIERNMTNDCRAGLCAGIVRGLRAYTQYNASIAAVSFSDQPGYYSDRHAIATLASAPEPLHPPPAPTLITNTSVALSWTEPEDNGASEATQRLDQLFSDDTMAGENTLKGDEFFKEDKD